MLTKIRGLLIYFNEIWMKLNKWYSKKDQKKIIVGFVHWAPIAFSNHNILLPCELSTKCYSIVESANVLFSNFSKDVVKNDSLFELRINLYLYARFCFVRCSHNLFRSNCTIKKLSSKIKLCSYPDFYNKYGATKRKHTT